MADHLGTTLGDSARTFEVSRVHFAKQSTVDPAVCGQNIIICRREDSARNLISLGSQALSIVGADARVLNANAGDLHVDVAVVLALRQHAVLAGVDGANVVNVRVARNLGILRVAGCSGLVAPRTQYQKDDGGEQEKERNRAADDAAD